MLMPACTRTSPAVGSAQSSAPIRASETSVPPVSAAPVNEWPEPATRTQRPAASARSTAFTTSAAVAGRSTTAGSQRWSPAQLVHMRRTLACRE